jgi:hypothetical protein
MTIITTTTDSEYGRGWNAGWTAGRDAGQEEIDRLAAELRVMEDERDDLVRQVSRARARDEAVAT